MLPDSQEGWHAISVIANFVLGAGLALAGIEYLIHRMHDAARWRQFIDQDAFLRNFLTQEMVDMRLAQLAASFSAAAQQQARVLSHGGAEDADIGAASLELADAKKEFWEAHRGAIRYNYKVRSSFRAYLPTGPVAAA